MNRFATALLLLFFATPATAQEQLPPVEYAVEVTAVAPRTAASSSVLRNEMFSHLFVESPADILRSLPGLVISQHAGGGKSDQYLIRGFDADHGTDVHLSVDGVPVNMVSHAHGQGYADLHWVIPETVERFDVHKGPYYAEFGNLATAGAVQLTTRDRFERSFVKFHGGSFDTGRLAFGLSPNQGTGPPSRAKRASASLAEAFGGGGNREPGPVRRGPRWLAGGALFTKRPVPHPPEKPKKDE